jgi:hypothetical protein
VYCTIYHRVLSFGIFVALCVYTLLIIVKSNFNSKGERPNQAVEEISSWGNEYMNSVKCPLSL